jgi:hypothetical protein
MRFLVAVTLALGVAITGATLSAQVEKTCVDHKGNYIWVDDDAVSAHVAHGDTVVEDELCTGV